MPDSGQGSGAGSSGGSGGASTGTGSGTSIGTGTGTSSGQTIVVKPGPGYGNSTIRESPPNTYERNVRDVSVKK